MSRGMWETVETKAGEVRVAEIEERRSRKEIRKKEKKKEKKKQKKERNMEVRKVAEG